MIEALKQALEALEDVGVLTDKEWQAVHKNKANELRQAIRERALYEVQRLGQEIEQEPVERDWRKAPWGFGEKRLSTVEYSDIVSDGGLDPRNKFDTPPQRTEQEPVDYEKLAALGWQAIECGICGGGAMGYPQRTWAGLTKDEVDSWNLPDHPTVFEFAQFIEARLKEKNT